MDKKPEAKIPSDIYVAFTFKEGFAYCTYLSPEEAFQEEMGVRKDWVLVRYKMDCIGTTQKSVNFVPSTMEDDDCVVLKKQGRKTCKDNFLHGKDFNV